MPTLAQMMRPPIYQPQQPSNLLGLYQSGGIPNPYQLRAQQQQEQQARWAEMMQRLAAARAAATAATPPGGTQSASPAPNWNCPQGSC
jgi:hypothetical protein